MKQKNERIWHLSFLISGDFLFFLSFLFFGWPRRIHRLCRKSHSRDVTIHPCKKKNAKLCFFSPGGKERKKKSILFFFIGTSPFRFIFVFVGSYGVEMPSRPYTQQHGHKPIVVVVLLPRHIRRTDEDITSETTKNNRSSPNQFYLFIFSRFHPDNFFSAVITPSRCFYNFVWCLSFISQSFDGIFPLSETPKIESRRFLFRYATPNWTLSLSVQYQMPRLHMHHYIGNAPQVSIM